MSSDSKASEPQALQIVKIAPVAGQKNKFEVVPDDDSLDVIVKNLEKLEEETGVDKLSIVSVMGAYRTGKSFLLDVFLRYLQHDGDDKEKVDGLPGWLVGKDPHLREGKGEVPGFFWRGGMDKCTEGIWMWSKPFLREVNGEKCAVLLMDTQGAFDSRMSKEHSATIFGLTAVMSSKQVYNISMQIQEDKIDSLKVFMDMATAALRLSDGDGGQEETARSSIGAGSGSNPAKGNKAQFQTLEFLVRDWQNFSEGMPLKEKIAMMDDHLKQHMDPENVAEPTTVVALTEMFNNISCFLLPHPGLIVSKPAWDGNLKELEPDFLNMLDEYVQRAFREFLHPKQLFGQCVHPSTLKQFMSTYLLAFKDAAPQAQGYAEALAQNSALLAKDAALKAYKKEALSWDPKHKGINPEELEGMSGKAITSALELYRKRAVFGDEKNIGVMEEELKKDISQHFDNVKQQNEWYLQQVLAGYAGLACVAAVLFLLDRITDWTCDWWSSTCQAISSGLLTGYGIMFVVIGYQFYIVYRDQGNKAAMLAGMELGKSCIQSGETFIEKGIKQRDVHFLLNVLHSCPGATQAIEALGIAALSLEQKATDDEKPKSSSNKKKD